MLSGDYVFEGYTLIKGTFLRWLQQTYRSLYQAINKLRLNRLNFEVIYLILDWIFEAVKEDDYLDDEGLSELVVFELKAE